MTPNSNETKSNSWQKIIQCNSCKKAQLILTIETVRINPEISPNEFVIRCPVCKTWHVVTSLIPENIQNEIRKQSRPEPAE